MRGKTWLWSVRACCAAACLLPPLAVADMTWESHWGNTDGGSWAESGNWDNGVPDAEAAAVFNLGVSSAYTVSFSESAQTYQLQARSGTIDFNLGGHTLDILDVLFVGYQTGDDAYLRPDNGVLTSVWADVGSHTPEGGASGQITLDGPDVQWVNYMDVTVARGSFGQLDVLAGAVATIDRYAYVGNSGSGELHPADGTVNVDGQDSTFSALRLTIGFAGNGGAAAAGHVSVTDQATLDIAAQIAVGSGGNGYLDVSGGATVTSAMGTSPSFSSGILGAAYPDYYGRGQVTVSGGGTSWTQDGSLSVGFTGEGVLTVEGGAFVESRFGHVARRAGAIGQATITGDFSVWNVPDELYVGGEAGADRGGLGAGGQGRLDVRNGGLVTIGGRLELWDQGTVDVTGGGRLLIGTGVPPADADQAHVGPGGLLAGTGTVLGTVVNIGGTIAPGHSIGRLTVQALDQQAGSVELEIGGPDAGAGYDVLEVQGSAILGGDLTVSFTDGFVPTAGQTFEVLTAGAVSGQFDGAPVWHFSAEKVLLREYASDKLTLRATWNGDATRDGTVDVSDLSILAGHYRQTTGQSWAGGDFTGDGAVDVSDLSILAGNYRKSTGPPPSGAPIPEPGSAVLLVCGALAALRRRFRRQALPPSPVGH